MTDKDLTLAAGNSSVDQGKGGAPIFMMGGLAPSLEYGVLRRSYRGQENNAHDWVHAKLHPDQAHAPPVQSVAWSPNCARHDVLLPTGASDSFLNPALLVHSFEAEAGAYRKDLIVHLKLTAPSDGAPLHEFWERVRAFARTAVVNEAGLPTIIVLHNPALTVMRHPPAAHVHLIAMARRLEPRGWGAATDRANDEAHDHWAAKWSET